MANSFVKSDENKKIKHFDANNLYGWAMSLIYDEIKFAQKVQLWDKINTPDDSDREFFVDCELSYPGKTKEKRKTFSFCLGYKSSLQITFS